MIARLWVLHVKEWTRLARNPAALMAVGLLILMAMLVSIESKVDAKAARVAKQPCLVVYDAEHGFITGLKAAGASKHVSLKFVKYGKNLRGHIPDYPAEVNCAVEISISDKQPKYSFVFRHSADGAGRTRALADWVNTVFMMGTAVQSTVPLTEKSPPQSLSKFDLGSSKSRAMVSAMLLFSAQFFVCCALFISFTAHERERGILQALALTPAGPGEILLSKVLFHLSLSLVASVLMALALQPWLLLFPPLWLVFVFSSLGLIAVAALIASFSRTQASASLIGFCYLMGVGVVFALSQNFPVFAAIRAWMFENHAIAAYASIYGLEQMTRKLAMTLLGHLAALLLLSTMLCALAAWVWNRRGWRAS